MCRGCGVVPCLSVFPHNTSKMGEKRLPTAQSFVCTVMYLQETLLENFLGNQVEGHEETALNHQQAYCSCL